MLSGTVGGLQRYPVALDIVHDVSLLLWHFTCSKVLCRESGIITFSEMRDIPLFQIRNLEQVASNMFYFLYWSHLIFCSHSQWFLMWFAQILLGVCVFFFVCILCEGIRLGGALQFYLPDRHPACNVGPVSQSVTALLNNTDVLQNQLKKQSSKIKPLDCSSFNFTKVVNFSCCSHALVFSISQRSA